MHGMRRVAKSIQDEHVEILQQGNGRFGHGAEIGEIGGVAKTEAENRDVAMNEWNRSDCSSEQANRAVDQIDCDKRHRTEFGLAVKDVGESAAQNLKSFFARKNGKRRTLAHIEWANVVESENVVGVSVSEEDGVQALDAGAQGLLAKVWSRIDDNVLAIAGKKQGRAETVVARIA